MFCGAVTYDDQVCDDCFMDAIDEYYCQECGMMMSSELPMCTTCVENDAPIEMDEMDELALAFARLNTADD